VTDRLWEDYQAFIARDLSGIEDHYLFLDAIFESLRAQGAKEALLVGGGRRGAQAPIAPACWQQGAQAAWAELLANLLSRGMRAPATVKRRGTWFGQSDRGRLLPEHPCPLWAHRLAKLRSKLADEAAGEVMAHI
jgi:hypothetical protein